MAYETVKRNRYYNPDPVQTANHVSKNHYEDLHDFHIPLERMHNSNLHDLGIARGLEVSGTIGGTEIIVNSGVAVDINGQLISLSSTGHGDIGENPPEGENNEVAVPVHLSTVSHAGKTVYITIQFSEILQANEGVLGRLEQVPWVRLQPVDAYDGKSIVLAIAVIKTTGELFELKSMDSSLPHRRRLVGETIEELRIQRSSNVGDNVQEILSGKIGPGDAGGLKITVPESKDSILFAREDGGDFATLEVHANVGIGTMSPDNLLEIKNNGDVTPGVIIDNGKGRYQLGTGVVTANDGKFSIFDINGNSNRFVIAENGNVGIGTMNPGNLLEIKNNGDVTPAVIIDNGTGRYQLGTGVVTANDGKFCIYDHKTNGHRLVIDEDGNVGIGTMNPSSKLTVAGSITSHGDVIIDGNVTIKGRLGTTGQPPDPRHGGWLGGIRTWDLEVFGTFWANRTVTDPLDIAENYPSDMDLEPAEVVCLDEDKDGIVISEKPNDPLVLGVVSTEPGFLLNAKREAKEKKVFPVALCGRVPCKVVDENGPIKRGDLLTSSSTPGHAMKANPVKGEKLFQPGTIIGKAISTLESGKGVIDIFIFSS